MRRPHSLFLIPGLFAAGCAVHEPAPDPVVSEDDSASGGSKGDDIPQLEELQLSLDLASPCESLDASFEIVARYANDPNRLAIEPECHITFDDGATYAACVGQHVFEIAGMHSATVYVRDFATGAVGRAELFSEVKLVSCGGERGDDDDEHGGGGGDEHGGGGGDEHGGGDEGGGGGHDHEPGCGH